MRTEYLQYLRPEDLSRYSRSLIYDYDIQMSNIDKLSSIPFDDYTLEQLGVYETTLNGIFQRATDLNRIVPSVSPKLNVDTASANAYAKIIAIKKIISEHKELAFPPEYVFPRNPNLAHYLTPRTVFEEKYNEDGSGLKFELGFTGTMNIIRTKYPPYLDRAYYDFKNKVWNQQQFTMVVGKNTNVVDITPYFSNSLINFSGSATGINDRISYYFDGEKIVTNYDFTNVEERKLVKITYRKLLNSLRVKAIMKTNLPGLSHYTPVVDQFTLLVDKQRVLN